MISAKPTSGPRSWEFGPAHNFRVGRHGSNPRRQQHIARRGCRLDELCASGLLWLISSSRLPFSAEDCFFPSTDFAPAGNRSWPLLR